ncbi:MAG: hypothetical protein E7005_00785 [Alphaproteobacteria bacterium]|nr:hypothetical protein [Alphaproteobacteria bacterium]
MRKYILMLTCSLVSLASFNAKALTPNEQLQAMKGVFENSFEAMDTNEDGVLNKEEYLNYQFEEFRSNILEADSFDADLNKNVLQIVENKAKEIITKENIDTPKEVADDTKKEDVKEDPNLNLKDSINIMQQMADFSLDDEEPVEIVEETSKENAIENTKEDALPALEKLEFEDVKEDAVVVEPTTPKDKEINEMLSVVKKSLPKKIDDITDWVDIEYKDKVVSYVYKANVDTATFSNDELMILTDSIKNDSCPKAYESMCPKIKPLFIDEGINMRIRYIDVNDKELNFCEFNKETCNSKE